MYFAKEWEIGMISKKMIVNIQHHQRVGLCPEKFDGYRVFIYEMVDGKPVGKFYIRNGKPFNAAEWFLESMPPPEY